MAFTLNSIEEWGRRPQPKEVPFSSPIKKGERIIPLLPYRGGRGMESGRFFGRGGTVQKRKGNESKGDHSYHRKGGKGDPFTRRKEE